jgi:hypothetical protein
MLFWFVYPNNAESRKWKEEGKDTGKTIAEKLDVITEVVVLFFTEQDTIDP